MIIWWKFFAVNDILKSGTHGCRQMLSFIPLRGLYCSCCLLLLVCKFLCLLFCLQWVKVYSIGLTWPLAFALRSSWLAFAGHFGSLSISTCKCCCISFASFGWIWAEDTALYTSGFILLLPSAVSSTMNTRDLVPLAVIHANAYRFHYHVWQIIN